MLFTIGWYMAEGFSSTIAGKGRFVSFSGHAREEPILRRVEAQMNRLGIRCSFYRSKKSQAVELRAFSAELARWFAKWLGEGVYNKRLPPELMSLSVDQSRVLLDAYVAGDGYKRGKQTEWVSASATLASQFALLAARCQQAPTLRLIGAGKNTGQWIGAYTTDSNPSSPLLRQWTDTAVYQPVRSVTTHNARDVFVNDLSVDEDESFVVGQASVHNCHRIGQVDAVNAWYLLAANTIDETTPHCWSASAPSSARSPTVAPKTTRTSSTRSPASSPASPTATSAPSPDRRAGVVHWECDAYRSRLTNGLTLVYRASGEHTRPSMTGRGVGPTLAASRAARAPMPAA
jgi:hypothetical protein